MKVVLLKDAPGIGKKNDIKDVSNGHALNFLIPRGLAMAATQQAIAQVEAQKAREAEKIKHEQQKANEQLSKLSGAVITMTAEANEKGHLFAGIHKAELVPQIKEVLGLDVDTHLITLDKPIKETGDHTIEAKYGDKAVKFRVVISSDKK